MRIGVFSGEKTIDNVRKKIRKRAWRSSREAGGSRGEGAFLKAEPEEHFLLNPAYNCHARCSQA